MMVASSEGALLCCVVATARGSKPRFFRMSPSEEEEEALFGSVLATEIGWELGLREVSRSEVKRPNSRPQSEQLIFFVT